MSEIVKNAAGDTLLIAEVLPMQDGALNVQTYGARGDGVILYDAVLTSGSDILTSSSASFSSSDIGKTIVIQPTVTTRQVLTIAAVTDANTVTLSANASANRSGTICYYGTDDTEAIQAAIDAAYAAFGGKVLVPSGIYIIAGALQDTSARNSVLLWPNDPITSNPMAIELEGTHLPGSNFSYTSQKPWRTGTVLYCPTPGSGTLPAVISGSRETTSEHSSVAMVISNIAFVCPANPTLGVIKGVNAGTFRTRNVSCVIDCAVGDNPEPTNAAAIAINSPVSNNNGSNELDSIYVMGYYTGVRGGEHTFIRNAHISFCRYGLQVSPGSGMWGYGVNILGCIYSVHCDSTSNPCYLSIFGLETEDYEADGDTWPWRETVANFLDTNDQLRGFVVAMFSNHQSGGANSTPLGTLPSKMQIINLARDREQNPKPLPKFNMSRAGGSDQSVLTADGTQVVTWPTEYADSEGWFASNKWTPLQAGYYQFNVCLEISAASNTSVQVFLRKNGSDYTIVGQVQNQSGTIIVGGPALIYCNGTTDYIEVVIYSPTDVTVKTTNGRCYFQGHLVP